MAATATGWKHTWRKHEFRIRNAEFGMMMMDVSDVTRPFAALNPPFIPPLIRGERGGSPVQTGKHWLCVAYAFPPINRSGTHRTAGFVKHLARLGWDATVLTVEPGREPIDESLSDEVPASTTVIRTPWIDITEQIKGIVDCRLSTVDWSSRIHRKSRGNRHSTSHNPQSTIRNRSGRLSDWTSHLLQTPDSRIGWIGPAVRAGLRAIRHRRPDVIYSTSPYMSAHLIALVLSRWARLPWVADFRDPWRGNPFRELSFSSLERWDAMLEWIVLRSAAHIVCSTPTMTEELRRRRPFVADKCTTILNGFDVPSGGVDNIKPTRIAPPDHFVLTHCGQFYGPRSPGVWFAALRRALDRTPALAGRVHVVLTGPETYNGRSLSDWASQAGVRDCVRVIGQKSHAEALSYLAGSDALILAGSAGEGAELQVPNKLFEYLAFCKPIIATCARTSPIRSILRDAGAEALVCEPDDERALTDAIVQLAIRRHVNAKNAWGGVSRFDRSHRAQELAQVFRRVSARSSALRNPQRRACPGDPIRRPKYAANGAADLASTALPFAIGHRHLADTKAKLHRADLHFDSPTEGAVLHADRVE